MSSEMFGKTVHLPCDILFGRVSDMPSSLDEYIYNLEARLESVNRFTKEKIYFVSNRV